MANDDNIVETDSVKLEFHQWVSTQFIGDNCEFSNARMEAYYDASRRGLWMNLIAMIAQKEVARIEVKYPDGWFQYIKMRMGLPHRTKFFPITILDLYPSIELPGFNRKRVYIETLKECDEEDDQ